MLARIILSFAVLLLLAATSTHGGFQHPLRVTLTVRPSSTLSVGDTVNLTCEVRSAQTEATVQWWLQPTNGPKRWLGEEVDITSDGASSKYTQTEDTSTITNQTFTLAIHNLSFYDHGTYFCRAEAGDKIANDSRKLTVEGKPEVKLSMQTINGLIGYDFSTDIYIFARPPATDVDWFGPSGNKLSTGSPFNQKYIVDDQSMDPVHRRVTLSIRNFSRDDSGEYTVNVTNTKGTTETAFTVNADPFVDVVTPNSSLTFTYGTTAVFICRACNFNTTPTFFWYIGESKRALSTLTARTSVSFKVNSTRMGTTESTVTIRGITFDFNGSLVCETSDSNDTGGKTIKVIGAPVVHSPMRTIRGSINDTVELACDVTANPPPTKLLWLFKQEIIESREYPPNKLTIDIHQEMRYEVKVTSPTDYGSYTCQVTNPYGTISYSINLVGPLRISFDCPDQPCTDYKVCDEDRNKCVCPSGKIAYGDTCKPALVIEKTADGYLWVGAGAGTVLVVTIVMGVILFVCWKRRADSKKTKKDELSMVSAAYTHAQYASANIYEVITRPSDEFPRERLRFHHPLGVGKFGRVMKAEALSINKTGKWEDVAVKMCQESATDLDKEDLYNELLIIRKIPKHINVVSFYGACTYGEPLLIILEFVPGGDLRNYLRRKRPDYDKVWESPNSEGDSPLGIEFQTVDVDDGELTAKDLLSFALQAAKGMQHLEANNIVHRDVAARNVLIGYNGVCKISDFGLARDVEGVDVYERTSKGPLPVRWMSPESLMEGSHSHKADVWAFGILLWEIVTLGASPYSTLTLRTVIDSVMAGKRLERPQHCMDELYSLMCRCWDHSPKDRPEFADVSKQLEYLLEKEADYIQLDQFQEAVYMVLEPDSTEEKL